MSAGVTPGGMSPEARDSFYEPVRISPIRIVEQGRLREDLEEMYLRQSRLPGLLGLDLRAAISGNLVAQKRILELVDRYGAGDCQRCHAANYRPCRGDIRQPLIETS